MSNSNYQQNIDKICSDLLGKLDSIQITAKTLRDALDKGANRCSCCREQIISVLERPQFGNELLCDMCYKAKRVLGTPAFETVYKDKTWLDKIYDDAPAENQPTALTPAEARKLFNGVFHEWLDKQPERWLKKDTPGVTLTDEVYNTHLRKILKERVLPLDIPKAETDKLRQATQEIVDKMTLEEKKVYNNFKKWGKVGDESKDVPLHEDQTANKDCIYDSFGLPIPTPPTEDQLATMLPRDIHRMQMDKYYAIRGFSPERRKEHEAIFSGMDTITGLHDGIWGNCTKIRGDAKNIRGDVSNISRYVTQISGDVSNIRGDVSNLEGDVSRIYGELYFCLLTGDVSKLRGDITGICGKVPDVQLNLDDFDITPEHRKYGFNLNRLVEEPEKFTRKVK